MSLSFCDNEYYALLLGMQVSRELTIARLRPDIIVNNPDIYNKELKAKTELLKKIQLLNIKNRIIEHIQEHYNILYLKNNIDCETLYVNFNMKKNCDSVIAEETILKNIKKFITKNIKVSNIAVFNVMHIQYVKGNKVTVSMQIKPLDDALYQAHCLNLL